MYSGINLFNIFWRKTNVVYFSFNLILEFHNNALLQIFIFGNTFLYVINMIHNNTCRLVTENSFTDNTRIKISNSASQDVSRGTSPAWIPATRIGYRLRTRTISSTSLGLKPDSDQKCSVVVPGKNQGSLGSKPVYLVLRHPFSHTNRSRTPRTHVLQNSFSSSIDRQTAFFKYLVNGLKEHCGIIGICNRIVGKLRKLKGFL